MGDRRPSSLTTDHLPLPKRGSGGFFSRNAKPAIVVAVLAFLSVPITVSAFLGEETIQGALGFLLQTIIGFAGQLLLLLVGVLIWVAQYNGFIDAPAVTNGWIIVRDISNMFFIVSLLIIAFGIMLGLDSYGKIEMIPRLVIMAILINFSRTICGLIIDFAQVIMLTFVNGFKEAAGGNFINGFGVNNLLQMTQREDANATGDLMWALIISLMLALVLTVISIGVVMIMIAVLVTRIVTLWLLIVMSPLAFLASTVPISKAKSFYGTWWEKFNAQVIVGPFMAFFLWLALVSVASDNLTSGPGSGFVTAEAKNESLSTNAGSAFQQNDVATILQKFIIGIALMLGGVQMAGQFSSAVGSATGGVKAMGRFAGGVAIGAGKLAGKGIGAAGGLAYRKSGLEGAVDRTRERAYTGLGKIPLVGGLYRKQALKQREAIAEKTEAAGRGQGNVALATSDELEKMSKGSNLSYGGRARKQAALAEQLKRAGNPTGDSERDVKLDEKTFHAKRKEGLKLDALSKTDTMKQGFDGFAKKNPRFIVDPSATGEEKKKQVGWHNTVWKGKGAGAIAETSSLDYTEPAMMTAGSGALAGAYGRMGDAQQTAMFTSLGMTGPEQEAFRQMDAAGPERANAIQKKQEALKRKPENFEYLSDEDKKKNWGGFDPSATPLTAQGMLTSDSSDLAKAYGNFDEGKKQQMMGSLGMSEAEQTQFETASISSKQTMIDKKQDALARKPENFEYLPNDMKKTVLEDAAQKNNLGSFADKLESVDFDASNPDDKDLLAKIGASGKVSGPQISQLSSDVAKAIRDGMTSLDAKMAAGGNLSEGIQGYDDNTGNMAKGDTAELDKWVESRPADEKVGMIPADTFVANNGVNDTALAVTANMNANDFGDILKSGDMNKVASVLQSLQGIANADFDKEVKGRSTIMRSQGSSESEIAVAEGRFSNKLEKAQAQAKAILAQTKKGGSLQSALSGMTYTGKAVKGAQAGAFAVGRGGLAVGRAGKAVGRGIGAGAEAIDKVTFEQVARAAREVEKKAASGIGEVVKETEVVLKQAEKGAQTAKAKATRSLGSAKGKVGRFRRKLF